MIWVVVGYKHFHCSRLEVQPESEDSLLLVNCKECRRNQFVTTDLILTQRNGKAGCSATLSQLWYEPVEAAAPLTRSTSISNDDDKGTKL